jgi:hypothetical protein
LIYQIIERRFSTAQIIKTRGRITANDSLEIMWNEAVAVPEFSGG